VSLNGLKLFNLRYQWVNLLNAGEPVLNEIQELVRGNTLNTRCLSNDGHLAVIKESVALQIGFIRSQSVLLFVSNNLEELSL